ncbi:biotin transporter BioY [Metabacillus halosaccharovorans]|uniref:biotin transporter BioY n=1 Tax=Metabacillus halosaccharovorans TaxID=930124 RepID=UPI0020424222|nr:biotin transporter BioY [Metabacillus halosaccharovorans]MCM3440065.1 biotin transporter BioY [Metabacillus halosaccharovorans]
MKRKLTTYDISLVGMFAALMAIGANITSWAPFLQVAGVPLSMQPFFCILAGLLLGSRLGALSMIIYALVGIAGAPVFAQFSGGISVIFQSTGGFILSYIVAAYAAGKILEVNKEKKLTVFMAASFVGIVLIYIGGTTYMWLALNVWLNAPMSYGAAWGVMAWFIVKDVAFTVLGALLAPRIYYTVTKAVNKRIAA